MTTTNYKKNGTDIGTLFCDLTNNQTINGTKTFSSINCQNITPTGGYGIINYGHQDVNGNCLYSIGNRIEHLVPNNISSSSGSLGREHSFELNFPIPSEIYIDFQNPDVDHLIQCSIYLPNLKNYYATNGLYPDISVRFRLVNCTSEFNFIFFKSRTTIYPPTTDHEGEIYNWNNAFYNNTYDDTSQPNAASDYKGWIMNTHQANFLSFRLVSYKLQYYLCLS
jgi:hypothetical protein